MRRYRIEVSGNLSAVFDSTNADGTPNPGALDVEFDIPENNFAQPHGSAKITIWGLPLVSTRSITQTGQGAVLGPSDVTISQATNLNGATVSVWGGMQKGLPLANPSQYGPILQGQVFEAYGNWVENDMTLDMIIKSNAIPLFDEPANIVMDWKKGTKLADALRTTLMRAFPKMPEPIINISDKLVLTENDQNQYGTLSGLAQHVNELSTSIIKEGYFGVVIAQISNTIIVFDETTKADPKQIAFNDMIGQPTWIGNFQVQVNLVLRSDIKVSDYIQFPKAAPTISTAEEQGQQVADRTAFQGTFIVVSVRHVGRFRQPTASSWVTVVQANSVMYDPSSADTSDANQ